MNRTIITTAQGQNGKLDIEFLFLDLTRCPACLDTRANLEAALQAVKPLLAITGTEVDLHKILIDSPAKAQQYHLVATPTLRINGQELALTSKTSTLCPELRGWQAEIACGVWAYQGVEFAAAPVELLVEAILHEVLGAAGSSQSGAGRVVGATTTQAVPDGAVGAAACCGAKEQQSCCAPSAKASCCGATAAAGSCGCK